MHNSIIVKLMEELDLFYKQLDEMAPIADKSKESVRKNFSTFYVVCAAAVYENCIRDILYEYSDFYHKKFSFQVERKYERLNSKIKYIDLKTLINSFDGNCKWFDKKCGLIGFNFSLELKKAYDQLLDWRHSAAHANKYPTSLEEVYKTHTRVKYVIYAFEESLLGHIRHQLINEASKNAHFAKKINGIILSKCDDANLSHMEIKQQATLDRITINSFKHLRRRAVHCSEKSASLLNKFSFMLEKSRQLNQSLMVSG